MCIRDRNTGCIQAEESLSGIRKEIEVARPRYELLARIEQAQDILSIGYICRRSAGGKYDGTGNGYPESDF